MVLQLLRKETELVMKQMGTVNLKAITRSYITPR